MSIRSKSDAQNALRTEEVCSFQTQNLECISSLKQLGTMLAKMRADVYNYHVGKGYNHFSNWIRDVFGDDNLAKDVFSASKTGAAKAVKERVKWLEKKAK